MPKRKYASTPRTASKRARAAPKALARKTRKPRYRANYKLSKPFKAVLNTFLSSKQERHWTTMDITRFWVPPHPYRSPPGDPIGFFPMIPPITQVGIATVGGVVMSDNIEARSGAKTRMRSLRVSLTLRLNPTYPGYTGTDPEDATGLRYKVIVYSSKTETNYEDFAKDYFGSGTSGTQNNITKDGNTTEPWDAKMEHYDRPFNTQLFTIHASKSGMLTKGELNGIAGGALVGHTPSAVKNLVLNVRCKNKILRYASSGATHPTNFNPAVAIFWKTLNGFDYIQYRPHLPQFLQCVGNVRMSWDDLD